MNENRFFSSLKRLAVLKSSSRPLSDKWREARALLADTDVRREFLFKLDDPDWLPFLRADGFFDSPQAKLVTTAGTRYLPWPSSKYLARVAARSPQEVLDVLSVVETDNLAIHRDILDAALAMPADLAIRLVPKLIQYLPNDGIWTNVKDASKLCEKLAREGQPDGALALFKALFLEPESGRHGHLEGDQHWYVEGLKLAQPALVAARPRETIIELCRFLQSILKDTRKYSLEDGWDLSNMWRPTVEESEYNSDLSFESKLVRFVRESFENALDAIKIDLPTAIAVLDDQKPDIFRRIAIFLIRKYAKGNEELVRRTIMDRTFFDGHWFEHEYSQLVDERFTVLTIDQQKQWFSWVVEGPDLTDVEESSRETRVKYWRYQRLSWVKVHLTSDLQREYANLASEFGELEEPGTEYRVRVGWGQRATPYPLDELRTLPLKEVIEKVGSWRPTDRTLDGPSTEGLLTTFGELLSADLANAARQAELFKAGSPAMVRALLNQADGALRNRVEIPMQPVLQLCRWVVQHQYTAADPNEATEGSNKEWQWTRDAISGLIREYCVSRQQGGNVAQFDESEPTIADILKSLSKEPAKSYIVKDDRENDPRTTDFLTLAINSPRGKALDAALQFARWGAQIRKAGPPGKEIVPNGIDVVKGLREILDWQLEHASFEAFSLIGLNLESLYSIDRTWLESSSKTLFDLRKIETDPTTAFGWATWNTYLVWGRPYGVIFDLLRENYQYAVEAAAAVEPKNRGGREQPLSKLGEHLMVLHLRGDLARPDDDALFKRFLSHAAPATRTWAMNFAGRVAEGEQDLPKEMVDRLMTVWDWYWANVGSKNQNPKEERNTFGWWFAAKRFPTEWSIPCLEEFVKSVGIVEPDHIVIQRLAETSEKWIDAALRILDLLEQADAKGDEWHFSLWIKEAEEILRRGLAKGGSTRTFAEELIDRFGRRGFLNFGELLQA